MFYIVLNVKITIDAEDTCISIPHSSSQSIVAAGSTWEELGISSTFSRTPARSLIAAMNMGDSCACSHLATAQAQLLSAPEQAPCGHCGWHGVARCIHPCLASRLPRSVPARGSIWVKLRPEHHGHSSPQWAVVSPIQVDFSDKTRG